MADVISFESEAKQNAPEGYTVDVTLLQSQDIEFTITGVKTDKESKLKIAQELERIVRIIRSDALTEF